jgi:hypothetical protein
MLGGNETKRVAWKQRSLDEVATALQALIRRTRPGTDQLGTARSGVHR